MAQYNQYVTVAHNTYDAFRSATLGNGYNVDDSGGNQCWDFCALLWWQYDLRLVTKAGGGVAYECWTISRYVNAQPPFISLERKEDIKRGDCVVIWDRNPEHPGHIAFADQDWADNDDGYLNMLGQNQGQGTSAPSNIAQVNVGAYFLGIFRNQEWQQAPTEDEFPIVTAINYWWNDEE